MQRCCIYKLKNSKSTGYMEEKLSKYVIVEEFAKNPLDSDKIMQCVYKHIYIEGMEYTSNILGYCVLPCDVFEDYFELYMDTHEINEKLRELGIE